MDLAPELLWVDRRRAMLEQSLGLFDEGVLNLLQFLFQSVFCHDGTELIPRYKSYALVHWQLFAGAAN